MDLFVFRHASGIPPFRRHFRQEVMPFVWQQLEQRVCVVLTGLSFVAPTMVRSIVEAEPVLSFPLREVQLRRHGDGWPEPLEELARLPQSEAHCVRCGQTSAGVPRNEPGSPGAGIVGFDHAVNVAT